MTSSPWLDQVRSWADDDLAVVDHATAWTGLELWQRADAAISWLDAVGAPPGRAVPAIVGASPSALVLVVAGARSGRPIAPLGPLLTERELASCLSSVDGALVVADPSSLPIATAVARGAGLPVARLGDLEGAMSRNGRPDTPGEVAVVLHTSGTAGTPKRVDVHHGPLAARTAVVAGLLGLGPGARYVTAKGIHHIGGLGLTLAALAAGAAVIPLPRYSPDAWAGLGPLEPTHGSVVPTMVEDMLAGGRLRLPSLRLLQYGGAPIRPETLAALLAREPGLDVVSLYGQTEGSPLASLSSSDHRLAVSTRPDLLRAAGRAAPGVELRVEAGEVLARAAHLFRTGPDGWLRTGDLGHLDAEGYLYLTGRAGDVIVRGGENVHPLEVEAVLRSHPTVRDVAVAGVPDDRLGQTVGAWIVTAAGGGEPGNGIDSEELRAWARSRLAGFKVPTVWIVVDAIPRNANGKVLRRELRLP
jgi:acyl-CoA synthetase (AMP-forming)/AMP-acid ligase II